MSERMRRRWAATEALLLGWVRVTAVSTAKRLYRRAVPIWHPKENRVLRHTLVCFLGYVLWKALTQWMRRSGLGDAPRTPIEEPAKIRSCEVVLPARMADDSRRTIHLRCVTTADEAQHVLLNHRGLKLPQRLHRIDEVEQM